MKRVFLIVSISLFSATIMHAASEQADAKKSDEQIIQEISKSLAQYKNVFNEAVIPHIAQELSEQSQENRESIMGVVEQLNAALKKFTSFAELQAIVQQKPVLFERVLTLQNLLKKRAAGAIAASINKQIDEIEKSALWDALLVAAQSDIDQLAELDKRSAEQLRGRLKTVERARTQTAYGVNTKQGFAELEKTIATGIDDPDFSQEFKKAWFQTTSLLRDEKAIGALLVPLERIIDLMAQANAGDKMDKAGRAKYEQAIQELRKHGATDMANAIEHYVQKDVEKFFKE